MEVDGFLKEHGIQTSFLFSVSGATREHLGEIRTLAEMSLLVFDVVCMLLARGDPTYQPAARITAGFVQPAFSSTLSPKRTDRFIPPGNSRGTHRWSGAGSQCHRVENVANA